MAKTYLVAVRLTFTFSSSVEVQAGSEEEAKRLALEEAECEWSDSELVASEAQIVEVS